MRVRYLEKSTSGRMFSFDFQKWPIPGTSLRKTDALLVHAPEGERPRKGNDPRVPPGTLRRGIGIPVPSQRSTSGRMFSCWFIFQKRPIRGAHLGKTDVSIRRANNSERNITRASCHRERYDGRGISRKSRFRVSFWGLFSKSGVSLSFCPKPLSRSTPNPEP